MPLRTLACLVALTVSGFSLGCRPGSYTTPRQRTGNAPRVLLGGAQFLWQSSHTATNVTRISGGTVGGLNDPSAITYDSTNNRYLCIDSDKDYLYVINPNTGHQSFIGPCGSFDFQGLAYDANTDTVYAVDVVTDTVYTIDTDNGRPTALPNPHGLGTNLVGLAFDPDTPPGTGTLYAADDTNNGLATIDLTTGVGTAVGPFGVTSIRGLAYDPVGTVLYGLENGTDELYTIDVGTGTATLVGALGSTGTWEGLAFDTADSRLVAANDSDDSLYAANTLTGAVTYFAGLGFSDLRGLASDPNGLAMWGVNNGPDVLVRVDYPTGTAQSVGSSTDFGLGFNPSMRDLAFDPASGGTLYGLEDSNDLLLTLDRTTGLATTIGGTTRTDLRGLAFDTTNTLLYAYDRVTQTLHTLNTTTGVASAAIGAASGVPLEGLAYDTLFDVLYGYDSTTERLYAIDRATGVLTAVGTIGTGLNTAAGLTFHAYSNALYAAETSTDVIATIDTTTGGGGSPSVTSTTADLRALAFDPRQPRLYGINGNGSAGAFNGGESLCIVNSGLGTGGHTTVGQIGVSTQVSALAVDPTGPFLYGGDDANDQLITIDPSTGAGTAVGAFGGGFTQVVGMAYDTTGSTLYGVDTALNANGTLVTIDLATGAATAVAAGPLLAGSVPSGLGYHDRTDALILVDTSNNLWSVDKTTAAPTLIGTAGDLRTNEGTGVIRAVAVD